MVASLYYLSVTLNFPISLMFFLIVVQISHWTQNDECFQSQAPNQIIPNNNEMGLNHGPHAIYSREQSLKEVG
jgi:hypothetical protein